MEQLLITLKTNPNKDVHDYILQIEDRAMKMLTLSIAVISLNFFVKSVFILFSTAPFFFFSFLFYWLAYLKSPQALIREISREELIARLESGSLNDPAGVQEFYNHEKVIRDKLFDSKDNKLRFMRFGHSAFFGLTISIFSVFIAYTLFPNLLERLPDAYFYSLVSVAFFTNISIHFYNNFFPRGENFKVTFNHLVQQQPRSQDKI